MHLFHGEKREATGVNSIPTPAERLQEYSRALHTIDDVLSLIDRCSPAGEAKFAHERAEIARACLLGAMPVEFELSLKLVKKALAKTRDSEAHRTAEKLLAGLKM